MIERPLISIIIPVYNAEKYLTACLESVLAQTYSNFEVLVIIDGGTDKSQEIANGYEKKDGRVRVLWQQNAGVSAARNRGIKIARGEYVIFVDADDLIHPDMLQRLYDCMTQENSDIAICNVACIEEWKTMDDCMKVNLFDTDEVENMTGRQLVIRTFFEDLGVVGIVAWNKLFKKEMWKKLSFPEDTRHEDECIIYQILYPLEKCSFIHENLYFYRRDTGSYMDNMNWRDEDILAGILLDQARYFKQKHDREIYGQRLAGALQYIAQFVLRYSNNQELRDIAQQKRQMFKLIYRKELLKAKIGIKQKLALGLFYMSPAMYGKILQKKGLL